MIFKGFKLYKNKPKNNNYYIITGNSLLYKFKQTTSPIFTKPLNLTFINP